MDGSGFCASAAMPTQPINKLIRGSVRCFMPANIISGAPYPLTQGRAGKTLALFRSGSIRAATPHS